jgi:hypothetical protein
MGRPLKPFEQQFRLSRKRWMSFWMRYDGLNAHGRKLDQQWLDIDKDLVGKLQENMLTVIGKS